LGVDAVIKRQHREARIGPRERNHGKGVIWEFPAEAKQEHSPLGPHTVFYTVYKFYAKNLANSSSQPQC
jgi:hypothetical protein